MTIRVALLASLLLPARAAFCQSRPEVPQPGPVVLPAGTPLVASVPDHLPMRVGAPVDAQLLYPVYAENKLVLPQQTHLVGSVIDLRPDPSRRIRARLGGDFTPFHIPVVRFTELVLPDGARIPITTETSTDGAPIFRAVAPPAAKGGFFRQQFDLGLAVARSDVALFTEPGKVDRLTQFVYNRLPYHPERIEKATAWTTEATAPISLPAQPPTPASPPVPAPAKPKRHFWEESAPVETPPDNAPGRWTIHAYLDQPLSSETSKTGQPIKATVASPIFDPDGNVAIPQGATLIGTIAKAQPARRFGRTGTLSFNFRQLTLPGGDPQNVETTLTGADSARDLALNSEGQVKSKPQDKISLPIILAIIASRPLDRGENGASDHQAGKSAASGAAGLGLVGTIIGLSGISPNAASGIGYYGTALAAYDRWIARGKKVVFPRDTRIVVQTVARRSAALHPDPAPSANPPQKPDR